MKIEIENRNPRYAEYLQFMRNKEENKKDICECQQWAIKYSFSPDTIDEVVNSEHHPKCFEEIKRNYRNEQSKADS